MRFLVDAYVMEYIIIDGYFSGTGIRDKYNGGYILPESLNLSPALIDKLKKWLTKYGSEFFNQYSDSERIKTLDEEGEIKASYCNKYVPLML